MVKKMVNVPNYWINYIFVVSIGIQFVQQIPIKFKIIITFKIKIIYIFLESFIYILIYQLLDVNWLYGWRFYFFYGLTCTPEIIPPYKKSNTRMVWPCGFSRCQLFSNCPGLSILRVKFYSVRDPIFIKYLKMYGCCAIMNIMVNHVFFLCAPYFIIKRLIRQFL